MLKFYNKLDKRCFLWYNRLQNQTYGGVKMKELKELKIENVRDNDIVWGWSSNYPREAVENALYEIGYEKGVHSVEIEEVNAQIVDSEEDIHDETNYIDSIVALWNIWVDGKYIGNGIVKYFKNKYTEWDYEVGIKI